MPTSDQGDALGGGEATKRAPAGCGAPRASVQGTAERAGAERKRDGAHGQGARRRCRQASAPETDDRAGEEDDSPVDCQTTVGQRHARRNDEASEALLGMTHLAAMMHIDGEHGAGAERRLHRGPTSVPTKGKDSPADCLTRGGHHHARNKASVSKAQNESL